MKESLVQKKLIALLLSTYPSIYVRKIAQGAYSHGGIPDLMGCLNGKFFAIEVKQEDGKTSRLQDLEIDNIHKANGMALVCYGAKDIEYIVKRLSKL